LFIFLQAASERLSNLFPPPPTDEELAQMTLDFESAQDESADESADESTDESPDESADGYTLYDVLEVSNLHFLKSLFVRVFRGQGLGSHFMSKTQLLNFSSFYVNNLQNIVINLAVL